MQYQKWMTKITSLLLVLSTTFVSNVSCHAIWGEVEIPESLRREVEMQEEE